MSLKKQKNIFRDTLLKTIKWQKTLPILKKKQESEKNCLFFL